MKARPSSGSNPLESLSPALLELVFSQIPIGVAIFDTGFRLVRCNPAFAQMAERYTSLTPEEFKPGLCLREYTPGGRGFFDLSLSQVLQGETLRIEAFPVENGGMVSCWDAILAPIFQEEQVIGILDILTDATERARALEKELETQTALKLLVENARHFALYRIELDPRHPLGGKVIFVSPSLKDIVGIDDPYNFEHWFAGIHPEDLARVKEANQRSIRFGEPYDQIARVFHQKKKEWVWLHTLSNPQRDKEGRVTHFDGMIIDLTNQVTLHEAERRQAVAEGLREILRLINSHHPLAEVLQVIARQAKEWLHADSTMIRQTFVEENRVRTVAQCDLPADFDIIAETPFYQGLTDQALMDGDVVIIEDIPSVYSPRLARPESSDDPLLAAGLAATLKYYHSLLKTPLFIRGQIFGAITFHFSQPRKFTDEDIQLARMLSDQTALAIENARLFEVAERRRQIAESLRVILSILNTERPLDEVLHAIVSQAQQLLGAKAVAVHRLDTEKKLLIPEASVGLSQEYVSSIHLPLGQGALGIAVLKRMPVQVNDTTAVFSGKSVQSAEGENIRLDEGLVYKLQQFADRYGAVLAVPMVIKSQIYGGLALYYAKPRNFLPEEVELAVTYADQASLAIENARLIQQVKETAVLEERSRLARDLHDAVTQTLFSTTLTAEVLPRIWEKDPQEGQKKLEELRELTRGALAEMRTLLVELRPAAMQDAELNDLIRHLGNAFIARARIPLSLSIEGNQPLPLEVKIAFYRVAQEALHNIAKHAEATQAWVNLNYTPAGVHLTIRDDGIGFDLNKLKPDHFGLGIMRERALQAGAQFSVESQPGKGTTITLFWQKAQNNERGENRL
ncbi:histidine kinase [Bellilinea caldifistulae]|uniref:GAF domain-containing protein n=1 Tax=Bellilinea caldifistulae TaxID=360411 RepID=UPI000783ADC3|nr:GAF domain-containing protein [Bellilinea caldifistulae]GAP11912.1 histidine kinase [Bellilinea caldifistulae]